MRPGQQQHQQQNKRMRGRGGRKGPNPMSRSFESNGPDVKIRGTAQHIADKYTTLARDASAAGDRIMAENYLQHAEHYGRIVAAAQGQFQPTQSERDYSDDYEEDGDEAVGPEGGFAPGGAPDRQQPQGGYGGGERQPFRENRDNGQGERPRRDNDRREGRGDRPFGNRDGQGRDGQGREGQGREDRRPFPNQPGTGPQPYAQGEGEGEFAAPRQDGGRPEGGRRENRRDRNRFNERSGERRFEERFGRPRDGQDGRGEEASASDASPQPHAAEAVSERQPEVTTPVAASPQGTEPARAQEAVPVVAETASVPAQLEEPRARAPRRRREGSGSEGVAATPVPSEDVGPPSVAAAEPAEKPPAKPRRAAKAAPATEAPSEPDAADGEPKRRAPRARRKKDDAEGEAEGNGDLPAFLLASNG
ncbi:DUF4167 domain-containing protein [Aureimonas sp. ME7]|uniref:DUF4167 domain-containing protein n=1 Tax=Aureimonas sp. ME7 TaxID=2744252 RepID=UPI0015F74AA7|nr:DUF4167 domain-containing protein [Aureimonas sp. ME7]